MNNNVNMGGMGPMGGNIGSGMPMMNNGVPRGQRAMPANENQQKTQLNTYIYEYFLRNEMYDCARSVIVSGVPINVTKNSPGGRDVNGNILENGDDGEGDSKDAIGKRPDDLPAPNVPHECPDSCFLFEWWCLFWDMFNAQRGKGVEPMVQQYVTHTQQQSRAKQDHQQQLLRQMRPDQMNQQQYQAMLMRNNPGMQPNDIARKAMQNSSRINPTPQQQQQMLHQQMMHAQQQAQQQQAQQQQQNQKQFQREGSEAEGTRPRPGSPRGENAPSPSKKPRLDGAPFNNGQQSGMMANGGRGPGQGMPDQQQLQNFQNAAMQQGGQAGKAQSIQAYTSNLVQHQANQMPNKGMPNPNGPQNQGSPMMSQNQDGSAMVAYYNPDGPMSAMPRPGVPGQPGSNGNHALQDYQMQLMLLEQQNKKRLMMARQEQDSLSTSPQGPRSGSSPNPDMKRGTPQMGTAGIPSPLPDGQSRGSPSGMNFMANGQLPPNMYGPNMVGMDGQMVGMRPPSSHPAGFNGGQMSQAQMMANMQRQGAAGQVPGWNGPNGVPMMQQTSQGPQPTAMGTPQARAMPPPSAPAPAPAGPAANGRTQPSSPQPSAAPPTPSQGNKANPKKGKNTKETAKRNAKKGNTTGATPAGDNATEPATPTPATPITPQHKQTFNNAQSGAASNITNGQTAPPTNAPLVMPTTQPDTQMAFEDPSMSFMGINAMDFTNPTMGGGDVLQDFDFDSFLHQDEGDAFAFDAGFGIEGGEVGAE